ncbi:hypothetical protein BH23ACT9_BH23ACT9_14750 [soil metagenome]
MRVACDGALGQGCPEGSTRLDLTALLAAFEGQSADYDVLVAPAVVVAMIEESGTSQVSFGSDREPVAQSPLVAVLSGPADGRLTPACSAEVTWACLSTVLRDGELSAGYPGPRRSSEGLAVLAALGGGFLGVPDYRANAFSEATFLDWLDAVGNNSDDISDPVVALIARGGAGLDTAFAVEATGVRDAERGSGPGRIPTQVHWPTPLATLTVVVVGVGPTSPDQVAEVARAASQSLTTDGGAVLAPRHLELRIRRTRADYGGRVLRAVVLLVVLGFVAAACDLGGDAGGGDTDATDLSQADAGDCITVDMAVSSEKIELLTDLAGEFNRSDEARVDGRCVFVRPQNKASGTAANLLADGWDEELEGNRPVIWSPASSAWGQVLNQRLSTQGLAPLTSEDFTPFMLSPLVIAMPEPMAEALGYPETPVGWRTIVELAQDPAGWAAYGHPEWGPFRLGKTHPDFSTSACPR